MALYNSHLQSPSRGGGFSALINSLRDCPRVDSPPPILQLPRRIYHHSHPPLSRNDLIDEALVDGLLKPSSGSSDLSDICHDPLTDSIFHEETSLVRTTTVAVADTQKKQSHTRSISAEDREVHTVSLEFLNQLAQIGYRFFVHPDTANMSSWRMPDSESLADYLVDTASWPTCVKPQDEGLFSTFDSLLLYKQIRQTPGNDTKMWAVGFDATIFSRSERLKRQDIAFCPYNLNGTRDAANKFARAENGTMRQLTYNHLCTIFSPWNNSQVDSDVCAEFLKLATAFFNGQEIPEDLDTLEEPDPFSPHNPHIDNNGDRANVIAARPLQDQVLVIFLEDVMISNYLEQVHREHKQQIFGMMKVYRHSSYADAKEKLRVHQHKYGRGKIHQNETARETRQNRRRKTRNKMSNDDIYSFVVDGSLQSIIEAACRLPGAVKDLSSSHATSDDGSSTEAGEATDTDEQAVASRVLESPSLEIAATVHTGTLFEASPKSLLKDLRSPSPEASGLTASAAKKKKNKKKKNKKKRKGRKATASSSKEEATDKTIPPADNTSDEVDGSISSEVLPTSSKAPSAENTIATNPVPSSQELAITNKTLPYAETGTSKVACTMPSSPESAIKRETPSISEDPIICRTAEETTVPLRSSQELTAYDIFGISVPTESSETGWETVRSKSAQKFKEKVNVSPAGSANKGNVTPSRTKSVATQQQPRRPQLQPAPKTTSMIAKSYQSSRPQAVGKSGSTLPQVARVFNPSEYPAIPSTGSKTTQVKSSTINPKPVALLPAMATTNILRSAKNVDPIPYNVTSKAVSSVVALSSKHPETGNATTPVISNAPQDFSDPEDLYGASPPRKPRATASSASNDVGPTTTTPAKVEEKLAIKDSGLVSDVGASSGSKVVEKSSAADTKDHNSCTMPASKYATKTQGKSSNSAAKGANVNPAAAATKVMVKVEEKISAPITKDFKVDTNSAATDVTKPSASNKSKAKGMNPSASKKATFNAATVPMIASSTSASKDVKGKGKLIAQEPKAVDSSSHIFKASDNKGQTTIAASDNVLPKLYSSLANITNGVTSKHPKQPRGAKQFRRSKLGSTEKSSDSSQSVVKTSTTSKISESSKTASADNFLASSQPVAETSGAPLVPETDDPEAKDAVVTSPVVKSSATAASDKKPVVQSISTGGVSVDRATPSTAYTKPPKIPFKEAIALAKARGELPHPDIFELTDSEDEVEGSTENDQRAQSSEGPEEQNAGVKESEAHVPSDLKWVDFTSPIKLRSGKRRLSLPSRISDESDGESEGALETFPIPRLSISGLPIPGRLLAQVQAEDPFTGGDIPTYQREQDRTSFTSSFTDDGEQEDSREITHLDATPGTELMVTPAALKTYEGEPYINNAGQQVLLFRREATISQPAPIHQRSYSGSGPNFQASYQHSYSGSSSAKQSAMPTFNPGYGIHSHPMPAGYGDQSGTGFHGSQPIIGNQALLPSIVYQGSFPSSGYQASQPNTSYSVRHGGYETSGSQAHSNMSSSSGLGGDLKGKGRDLGMLGAPSLSPILEMSTTSSQAIDPKPDQTFTCTYCEQIHRPTRSNPCYLCPFCGVGKIGVFMGPKYCSRACLLANAYDHYHSNVCLGLAAYENFTNKAALGEEFMVEDMPIKNIGLIPDSAEKFRQKMCSMYYKYGKVPNILNAHVKKMPSIGWRNILPAYEKQTVGDYHVFKSNTTGGTPSKSHIICTIKFLQADPMKSIITRLLSCCFLMQDPYITHVTYRILHFYLSDPHIFPTLNATTTQENVLKEFRSQFFKEFGLLTPEIESEPWYMDVMAAWKSVEPNVVYWENQIISLDEWNRRVFTYV